MALSRPEVSDSVQEEPIIGQDYLMCGTEGCEKNCQFTVITVTYEYVNNAKMNIKRLWKPRIMKWSLIHNAKDNFL